MPAAKKDTRPSIDFNDITQRGLKAYNLTKQYAAALAIRLDATVVPGLVSDLAALGTAVPAVTTAHDGSKQTTASQNTELSKGYQLVTATRLAVGRKQPAKEVLLAYGVGSRTNERVVKHVKAALQKIVDRATAQPKEAAGFSIIQADVDAMKKQITAIDTADQIQEAARASAPLSTKQRNIVARRILGAVDSIVGAGALAFATSATERAQFEALIKKAT